MYKECMDLGHSVVITYTIPDKLLLTLFSWVNMMRYYAAVPKVQSCTPFKRSWAVNKIPLGWD